jgi:hypothetical protein
MTILLVGCYLINISYILNLFLDAEKYKKNIVKK